MKLLYFILDLLITISLFVCGFLFKFNFRFWIISGAYSSVNAVIGLIWNKKKVTENSSYSANWFLPVYIVNMVSVFLLIMPFCQCIYAMQSRDTISYFFAYLGVLFVLVLNILGQAKWQKLMMNYWSNKFFAKIYLCIINPLRIIIINLFLMAFSLPSI